MLTLNGRTYLGEDDLEPIVDLLNACEAVDRLDMGISVTELREEFESPELDLERDLRLWEDADGTLAAFGQIWIPPPGAEVDGHLWFKVRPDKRGGHLEDEIINWGIERMREVGRERGVPAKLRTAVRSDETRQIGLLEQHRFAVNRYFFRMARPLDQPVPEPQFPQGFALRHLTGPEEVPVWVEMFNQSFIDHWNHHDLTVEQRLHRMKSADYKAEYDLLAVAPDGTFAAFCVCGIYPRENARTGRNEGWINLLGTRRGFRRIGLGRAMLLAGLRMLKAGGVDTAVLGVDADSLTGATRLYESVGFRPVHTFVAYLKDV